MQKTKVVVLNKLGLHARPCALLAKTANQYKSTLLLESNGRTVDAKSILGLMTMAMPKGGELTVIADGDDEADATARIVQLFSDRFGEAE